MWRATTIAALAVFLMACGGGSSDEAELLPGNDQSPESSADIPSEAATDAFERLIDYISKGQYGRAWDELHPAQQALVTRADYMLCRGDAIDEVKVVEILEEYDEDVPIPGTDLVVASTAITAELRLKSGLFEETTTDTFHEIAVDGEWRWIVSDPDDYDPETC